MEQTEMVSRLCEKAGCSAEDARDALERADWVLLDAMIILEREKKTARHTGHASSGGEDGREYEKVLPVVSTQKKARADAFGDRLREMLTKSLLYALVIRHKDREIARLPALYFIILLFAAPYVNLIGCLVALFCGCRLSVEGDAGDAGDAGDSGNGGDGGDGRF